LTGPFSSLLRIPSFNQVLLAVATGAIGTMFAGINLGLIFNDTHSAPFGLYIGIEQPKLVRTAPPPYIFFCPDVRWPSMKGQPNYRSPMRSCPDGFAPLIKPVVAWPGDTVETTARGLVVNGTLLPHTVPFERDSKGKAIHPYPYGTYRVQPGQLWAVSSFSPRSFDSRYFGPVPLRSVHSWIRPFWVEKTYHPETR